MSRKARICVALVLGAAAEVAYYVVESVRGYTASKPFDYAGFWYNSPGFWYTKTLPHCPRCDLIITHNTYVEIIVFACVAYGLLALLQALRKSGRDRRRQAELEN